MLKRNLLITGGSGYLGINLANKLLSRTWFIEGLVKKGKKLGRKLGYRTCNIRIKNYVLPSFTKKIFQSVESN